VPNDISGADIIENRPFDDINLGDTASVVRIVAADDISLFAAVSGDVNPAHMDPDFARTDMFHGIIAHGMFGGALISTVLGTCLPGPGTIYLAQDLRFRRPVSVGDTITATVTVTEKVALHGNVKLDCVCTNQRGEKVITGVAEVRAPSAKIRRPRIELPEVRISRHERYHDILRRAAAIPATPTAVVHPCDEASIRAVVEAEALKLIEPVLVGPREKILAAAARAHADVEGFEIVSTLHSHAAAEQAVELVRAGRVGLLMKGSLHTDELMRAVVSRTKGLRTARRISHVYLMDVPAYPRPLIITDAAINIAPTLDDKRDIVQNAIDLAHVMGVAEPCVAILSAVETVTGRLPGTLDAAALCKMADRGQITGAILDGPLAFDNAINPAAAHDKGIVSRVAGHADILVVPDLEAGNMLAKQLTFMAGADAAGVVLGARVPIILTSRADGPRTRIASCAVAALMAQAAQLPAAP
jgi:phosphate butyryltransferase